MKLLALAGDIDALIADIRLRTPLQALAERTGWSLVLRSLHDCRRTDLAAADVLIIQRGASRRAWRWQQAMHWRGGVVISEIDDLLTDLPSHISNHAAVQAQHVWARRCLDDADVVTVATERLGRELGVARAVTVPNYALPLGDAPLPAPQPGQPVTLLIASMERLASDFIYPALRAVQGAGVRIVVFGPPGAAFVDAGIAVQREPLMPRRRFIDYARNLPNVLAVIPLEDTRFASCKSALKWFEYAEAGIPVLCSDVSPYREVVRGEVTGRLVANDAAAWRAALTAAIGDVGWRLQIAAAARADVRRHHTLEHTAAAWQHAVEAAVRHRAGRGATPPTLGWRMQDAVSAAFEGSALRLRQFNRARLLRRQARAKVG